MLNLFIVVLSPKMNILAWVKKKYYEFSDFFPLFNSCSYLVNVNTAGTEEQNWEKKTRMQSIGFTQANILGLTGEPEGRRPLGRPRHRWVNNIMMDL